MDKKIESARGFRGQQGVYFSGIANYTDGRSVSGDDVLMFTDKLTELIESLGMEWGGGAKDVDLDEEADARL